MSPRESFFITSDPLRTLTLYPVTGRPPFLAGAVHRTVRDVAWMSSPDEVMLGGPGGSEGWKAKESLISER